MAQPTFGLTITQVDNEPRPVVAADLSTIGLVVTAPDADAQKYPFATPVLINSADDVAVDALGVNGTIAHQIDLINAQLTGFSASARIVISRAEVGADDDETMTNLIEALQALEDAESMLGVAPRLIGVPGFTYQQDTGVASISIDVAGTGYLVGEAITATGGGGTGFAAEVATIGGSGEITGVTITSEGSGYTSTPTLSVTTGGGTGATLTATTGLSANPIVAALPGTLEKLVGHAVITGPHDSLQGFTDWRETFASKRLIPVETWVKVGVNPDTVDSVGGVLGLIVARDNENRGRPFHSAANRPMQGIVDVNRPIPFSTTDGNLEGQQILALNGGIIVRGEAGSVTSLGTGGFTFVGTDTASEDDLWLFYNVTRGRDFIHLMFLRTLRIYLGRFNLTGQTIEAIVNTMKIGLRDLEADNDILGFEVGFEADKNLPEDLRLGKFTVNFKAEEPPVLRQLNIESYRYRPALDGLLDSIIAAAA